MEMKIMNKDAAALSPNISIFLYNTKEYKEYAIDNDTCSEKMCQQICKDLEMKPLVCTLFALSTDGTRLFLPGCRELEPKNKYNFRLRFQIKTMRELKTLDQNAYDYLYHQTNWDLINGNIPELVNPREPKVLGLCMANMFLELMEGKSSAEQMIKNYKNYLPRQSNILSDFLLKRHMANELKEIKQKHDAYYVKEKYLEGIATHAPNYFLEKCVAIAPYLPEDGLIPGTCPVELEFAPFHPDRPGLSIYYSYRDVWQHIAKIEDILVVVVNDTELTFDTRFSHVGYSVTIADQSKLESFVSCVAGYYRLMVKWTVDLCQSLKSPLLQELKDLKCHGPIGADFSYIKLHEKQSITGSYIIRQCEEFYDIYCIDIIRKSIHPETFKITKQRLDANVKWNLHMPNTTSTNLLFDNLQHLAKSIETDSCNKLRLLPSDYDKAKLLLLCSTLTTFATATSVTINIENELRHNPVQFIDISKDIEKCISTKKIIENGIIKEMQAEWLLPKDTKIEVTLKILNSEDHCSEFMKLSDKWSYLQSSDILKLYGLTLSSPYSMVTESTQLGPLDEFLQANQNISIICRLEASYSLVRALHQLEEKKIVHGNIRCASLYVVKFDGTSLVVRLGHPKLQNSYTEEDIPWIPVEYYGNMQQAMSDTKADIFAYSTTTWQIFSNGIKPPITNSLKLHRMLPRPFHCPSDMYELMLLGWAIPEHRFTPHFAFSTLLSTRDLYQNQYTSIAPSRANRDRQLSTSSNSTGVTVSTRLMSDGCISDFTMSPTERTRFTSEGYFSNSGSDNKHYKSDGNISSTSSEDYNSKCTQIVRVDIETGQMKSDESVINDCGENDETTDTCIASGSGYMQKDQIPSCSTNDNGFVPNGCGNDIYKSVGNISTISNISDLSNVSNISCYSISSENEQSNVNGGSKNAKIYIELDKGSRVIYDSYKYIGKGQYGTVYKGVMMDKTNCITNVAIKTLNKCPSKKEFQDFKKEVFVMSKIEHPHIIKIITWTDEPHIAIIMDYVEHGSLHKYLTKCSTSLDTRCLLRFAEDIAFGMEYLTWKNIVHRDLAARNILIDGMNIVKISDFGLSQFVNDKGYYRSQNRRFIPYKWYAPETLTEEKYSFKSDVWSYGITLFEIFSKGMDPNLESLKQESIEEFVIFLKKGHRLPRPEHCPANVYKSVMLKCWRQNPVRRPDFRRILTVLNKSISEYGEVIQQQ